MPRQARKPAQSGIYHVMLRGIDRQQIFEDQEDCLQFLDILQKCRILSGFKLYAYCLMGNHAHLLLKVEDESLEGIFKRLNGRYVYYYNVKYQRVGHLFQDRFRSEPVEDDAYFWAVIRYIHQNPVKAKFCDKIEDYTYSSYPAYLYDDKSVDTEFALSMMSLEEFIEFNNQTNDDQCLEIVESVRKAVTEADALAIVRKISGCNNVSEFQKLDQKKKVKFIIKMAQKGLAVRQINRLTGTSRGKITTYLTNHF